MTSPPLPSLAVVDGAAVDARGIATVRFYAELEELLAPRHRGRPVACETSATRSVKHCIESLGVPHTEVGLLLVDGAPQGFDYRPVEGDRIGVFPTFRRIDGVDELAPGAPLAAPGGDAPTFIADAQLGRLARWLRFAGYDTRWRNAWRDADLVALAADEGRIVLSRDRDLLMHRDVEAGCYVRDDDPLRQLADVASRLRLDLAVSMQRPARCTVCNGTLAAATAAEVAPCLPTRAALEFDAWWRCTGCARIYWRGSHWRRLRAALDGVAAGLAARYAG